ncbi:MAG: hypothetical protein IK052_06300 [Bacteroidales bacterium]|nr:hypothetical protein [Bacteroidales bacterium]
MEENFDALEVIARTRGKVTMDDSPTGYYLFPLWGWLTALFYMLEFVFWQWLHQEWCLWLWVGIPAVGFPLMSRFIRKDHERTHMRTREAKLVLDYWIFAACAIGLGGFLFGFAGIYEMVENPLICVLVGIGAFITGDERRFRPMILGGISGVAIGLGCFLLQGDLWAWQMLGIVLCAVVTLIIPGHMFVRSVKNGI